MLRYAVIFFVIALIAALFGFGGIAAGATEIAKILFFVFVCCSSSRSSPGLIKTRPLARVARRAEPQHADRYLGRDRTGAVAGRVQPVLRPAAGCRAGGTTPDRASRPHAGAGNRVRLRYHVELAYDVAGPSAFLLNVHAAQTPRQQVVEEFFSITPHRDASLDEDAATRQPHRGVRRRVRCRRWCATPRWWRSRIASSIRRTSSSKRRRSCRLDTLRFLYPSRYCQADLVQQQAWDRFGAMPRGYAQVRAVRDWVRETLALRGRAHRAATPRCSTRCATAPACAATSRTR